ncbi:ABC transporter permease [Lactobacillus sp. ESL0679]|uniref:ABC transporter permease n=1 Tax=Lactobacillus sp. ESL0679 TaxID=2983209 RepID=UPI0023F80055|nr:ABC transporter permease [Lactobacillus sp. ESL0679]MDF7682000.1 ABC transporter permease [Lactobacillus sp. ESL0679]
MSKLWTIISETYLRQVKSWSFLSLIFGPFLILAIGMGIGYFTASNGDSSTAKIVVVSSQPALKQAFISQNKKLKVETAVTSSKQAEKLTKKDDLQGYLVLNEKQGRLQAEFYQGDSDNAPDKEDLAPSINALQTAVNVQQARLTVKQVQELQTRPQLKIKQVTGKANDTTIKMITFMVVIFVVYFVILIYSSIMAQEVVADKGHKIIEIIFSSTTPEKYFCGKVIAILLMIITQMLSYIAFGLIAWPFAQHIKSARNWLTANQSLIRQILHNLLGSAMLYIILGVTAYVILAAYFGAISKSSANASQAAQWPTMICVVAFILALTYATQPHAVLVKILSYVPLFSSYFMPLRVFGGNVNVIEIMGSLLLLMVAIILAVYYIGKSYGRLMLQQDWSKRKLSLFRRN